MLQEPSGEFVGEFVDVGWTSEAFFFLKNTNQMQRLLASATSVHWAVEVELGLDGWKNVLSKGIFFFP